MKKIILGSIVAVAFMLFGATNAGASEFKSGTLIASSDKCGTGKCGGEKKSKCGDEKKSSKCGGEKKAKKCSDGKCGGEKRSSKCGDEKKSSKCGTGKCGS